MTSETSSAAVRFAPAVATPPPAADTLLLTDDYDY
jgi:hypothetical protein